jgi:PAT family beta-lactamase induction signal transducer AmpG
MSEQKTSAAQPALSADSPKPGINPMWFVPTLYFMQSVPNILVTESFTSVYKNMGVSNTEITFWTSIIALPWTFKLFWAPLVDLTLTKRRWTIFMQVLITGTLAVTAGVMATQYFWYASLAALFLLAILSATHDIACDGLYLMSLDRTRQAAFSGVMAMFSRFGRMFASFAVLYVGGIAQGWGIASGQAWTIALGAAAVLYGCGMLWNSFALPRPARDVKKVQTESNELTRTILRTALVIATGVLLYFFVDRTLQLIGFGIFQSVHSGLSLEFLKENPLQRSLPLSWHMTPTEVTWAFGIIIVTAILCSLMSWLTARVLRGTDMGNAFSTYFTQQGFIWILAFIVFYRFGEAMIFKIVPLFLQESVALGGLGLGVAEVGKIHGIAAPAGLIVGGLLGGAFIAKQGLRKAFWWIVLCMHTPNLLYLLAAYEHEWVAAQHFMIGSFVVNAWPMYPIAFVEAFGYGFGFAGYFVYLMWVAQRGNYTTSHYAIGTGLGALFITFAGITSGIVQESMGYLGFFIIACLFTIPGTLTLLFIPMDKNEGRGMKAASDH